MAEDGGHLAVDVSSPVSPALADARLPASPFTPTSTDAPAAKVSSYPTLHPDALASLVDAVREPLIVCLARVKNGQSGMSSGRVLAANPMACALLNRDPDSVKSMPLASLVSTASGRPPPHGLVSKCKLHCVGSEELYVECDCRVFGGPADPKAGEAGASLVFCHLTLMDVQDNQQPSTAAPSPKAGGSSTDGAEAADDDSALNAGDDPADGDAVAVEGHTWHGRSWPRARALAEVQLERLKILLCEDDIFSASAIQVGDLPKSP